LKKEALAKFIIYVFGVLLIVGGLGVETNTVVVFGFIVSVILLAFTYFSVKRVLMPQYFTLYYLFLLTQILSLMWSLRIGESAISFLLFASGGVFWVVFFNLKLKVFRNLDKLIIYSGLFFSILYLYNRFIGGYDNFVPDSLVHISTPYLNHSHIGDYWALLLILVIYRHVVHKERLSWLLIVLGGFLLALSQSRSAILSLAVGVFIIVRREGLWEKYRNILVLVMVLAAGLFIFTGLTKPTLLSRPYFVQGVVGLVRNPFGIGMGNFGIISIDPQNHLWGLSSYSSAALNIFMEVLSGIGMFGLVFIVWLIGVSNNLLRRDASQNAIYTALFFALTVNFFFDSTYFIPTMLWLWFVLLGLSQPSGGR
jgi:hypothetical protein